MSDKKHALENEREFDALIESSFSEHPPIDMTDEITPWRKATNRVIWGLALKMVTLQFLWLDQILPFIGTFMLLLGFRALRRENKWFRACHLISIVYAVNYFSSVVLDATVFEYGELLSKIMIAFSITVTLLLLICLWSAFRAVRKKAGIPSSAGSVVVLIVWYVVLVALALINYEGILIPILMIVSYAFIIRSLLRLSKELDEAGYAISAAPIKVSDRAFVAVIGSLIAVGIICGYAFFNSYPMKWAPLETADTAQITEIKEKLLELGFPENVLNDISNEDILACDGAEQVVCSYEYYSNLSNGNEIRFRSVAVRVPEDDDNWKMFHHFIWLDSPKFYGTEGIQIWLSTQEWQPNVEASGRVYYDEEGKTNFAPYYTLSTENSDYRLDAQFYAGFSMPSGGENYRGYISYGIVNSTPDSWDVFTRISYMHQNGPAGYPVMTALDKSKSSGGNSNGMFEAANDWFQFYIDPDSGEITVF